MVGWTMVGRMLTSLTRGHVFSIKLLGKLLTVNRVEKMTEKKNIPGMAHLLNSF